MGLEDDFKAAAEEVKTLPATVSNEDQLALYGLFKQANLGDNTTSVSKEEAMQAYIDLVAALKAKYA